MSALLLHPCRASSTLWFHYQADKVRHWYRVLQKWFSNSLYITPYFMSVRYLFMPLDCKLLNGFPHSFCNMVSISPILMLNVSQIFRHKRSVAITGIYAPLPNGLAVIKLVPQCGCQNTDSTKITVISRPQRSIHIHQEEQRMLFYQPYQGQKSFPYLI